MSDPWGYRPPSHTDYGPHGRTFEPEPPPRRSVIPLLAKAAPAVFVFAIFAFVGAMLVSNMSSVVSGDKKYADGDNLKGLMKAYVAGLADQKRPPNNGGVSEGTQFWIALYTTDGAPTPSDTFLEPGDAGFLVSPKDPLMREDDVVAAIADATGPNVTINSKTVSSYNGPSVATMRAQSTLSGKIIGCTGDRNGVPLHPNGTNLLYGNIKVEFAEWDEIASIPGTPVTVPRRPTAANFVVPLALPFAIDPGYLAN